MSSAQYLLNILLQTLLLAHTTQCYYMDQKCRDGAVLTVAYCHHDPYVTQSDHGFHKVSGLFTEVLQEMINCCCQAKIRLAYQEITSAKEFYSAVKNIQQNSSSSSIIDFDVAMPLHTTNSAKTSFGELSYIPIIESIGVAVLKHNNVSTAKLLFSLLQHWPVLMFIVITAVIAGIVMWFVEKHSNFNQFSPTFSQGAFDGFWWAFVSMTSVGYGDKCPKSIIGRILGSSWIVLGMLFTTMFIGTLTSTFMNLLMEGTYNMKNEKISVVYGSVAHWLSTSQRANIKVVSTQKQLFQPLINYSVDAALVDMNSVTDKVSKFQKKENIRVAGILIQPSYYGIVLRQSSTKLTTCFKDYIEKHESSIFKKLKDYSGIESPNNELDPAEDYFGSGGIFSISVYVMIVLFFTLSCAGIGWEIRKWYKEKHQQQTHEIEDPSVSGRHLNGRVAFPGDTEFSSEPACQCDQKTIELGLMSRQSDV